MSKTIKAKAPQPTQLETQLGELSPFLAKDPARTHLHKPWGECVNGCGYICAADGHRGGLIRSDDWKKFERDESPFLVQAVDWAAPFAGWLSLESFESAMLFPPKWNVNMSFGPEHATSLGVSVLKGRGKKVKKLYPLGLGYFPIDWGIGAQLLELGDRRFGIYLSYLLDALYFCGPGVVNVHTKGGLDPIIFVHSNSRDIEKADRIAVVMPVKL